MKTIFIFHRDLRLFDNTTLIEIDKITNVENHIIPVFIVDPYQVENKNKSSNCIQFMLESLVDLKLQLENYGSKLYIYYGKPWKVIEKLIDDDTGFVAFNKDYTVYSKLRDDRIMKTCLKHNVKIISFEDCMLNNIDTVKNSSGKYYQKFTPYYNAAKNIPIREPINHKFKNLIKRYDSPIKQFNDFKNIFTQNENLYIHGGRSNGLRILKNLQKYKKYNENRDLPKYDTTLLSPHNKFGTISIREAYYYMKNILGSKTLLLQQLYWRDFYYNQMYYNDDYFYTRYGKYANMKWKYDQNLFNKWKNGKTGIPLVDAAMIQLKKTGWIHNRLRMLSATVLTKIFHIDWRLGEKYFKKYLVDYDVTQNIMNWYWVAGEAPFANPYFRVLNPINQTIKNDKSCDYTKQWIILKNDKCLPDNDTEIRERIQESINKYGKQ